MDEPAFDFLPAPASPPMHAPDMPVAPPAQVLLPEAWKRSLPREQHEWVSKALFVEDQTGRAVLSPQLKLWYHPPGPQMEYRECPLTPDPFFQRPFFLWLPYRMWHYHLKCPICEHKLTGCGLYKTVRRVLDHDGWYYMGTEYLECRFCRKKVASWSECVRTQLDFVHQQLFPAVMMYRLACSHTVIGLMKGRTLGNGVSRLHSYLVEQHTAEWMRRSLFYLQTCYRFWVPGGQPPPKVPKMEPVPSSRWLLATYARESFSRIEELKAKVTSTFGSILKMDSTKKVTRKLAGADAGTAHCMTSVGNELGQVLMSVLTPSAEDFGLMDMAKDLQKRYQQAGRDPPQVLYVDRGCCSRDGGTCTAAALFPEWPQLLVRLDVRRFICRLAAGVTSPTHCLYQHFMQRVLVCIFEWDPEDLSLLREAKQADQSRRGNMLTVKEMSRHCRRRTRGTQETQRLLGETLQALMGATDTTGIPLLQKDQMEEIWSAQRKHIACIQDPPGIPLYTRTGEVNKGGVVVPVYRCARGVSSVASFHMHLNRFIPGSAASGCHFQVYLLEGLTRWNEDQAQAAAGRAKSGMISYDGRAVHTLNRLTEYFYGVQQFENYTDPLPYSGELIGMSYLYNQSDQMLQDFPDDLVEPDGGEELEIEEEEEELDEEDIADEGIDELVFDSSAPLQPLRHVLSSQMTPEASSGDQEGAFSRSTVSTYQDMPPLEEEEEEPIAGPSWAFPLPNTSITAATTVSSAPHAAILPPTSTAATVSAAPDAAILPPTSTAATVSAAPDAAILPPTSTAATVSAAPDAAILPPTSTAATVSAATVSSAPHAAILPPTSTAATVSSAPHAAILSPTTTAATVSSAPHAAILPPTTTVATLSSAPHAAILPPTTTVATLSSAPHAAILPPTTTAATVSSAPHAAILPPTSTAATVSSAPHAAILPPTSTAATVSSAPDAAILPPTTTAATVSSAPHAAILPPTSTAATVSFAPHAAIIPPTTTASTDAPATSTMYNRKRMMARQAEAAKRGKTLKFRAPSIVHCGSCGKRKIKETGHRLLTKANGQRVNYCPVAAEGQCPEDWLAGLE